MKIKLRDPRLVRAAGWAGARAVRGLIRTLRLEYRSLGPVVAPVTAVPPGPRYAYAMWHEYVLIAPVAFGHPDIAGLISGHADGQLIVPLIESAGMGTVFGSSTRGGVEAVRQLLNGTAGRRHLVATVDGPRGPRRVIQPGLIYVASRVGMSVVPMGVGYERPWRLNSWDRMAIPKPCLRAKALFGVPVPVPPGLRTKDLEHYRLIVQAEMDRLTVAAERWAATNKLDLPEPAAANPSPLKRAS